jgi:hypothetical protein
MTQPHYYKRGEGVVKRPPLRQPFVETRIRVLATPGGVSCGYPHGLRRARFVASAPSAATERRPPRLERQHEAWLSVDACRVGRQTATQRWSGSSTTWQAKAKHCYPSRRVVAKSCGSPCAGV